MSSSHIEDVKQDEKHVPDLLESIMRPTCLVKEELRPILCKLGQFRPEITKIRVSTFWMSGKSTDSRRRPTQPSRPVSFKSITALPRPNKSKKSCFWRRQAPFTQKMRGFGPPNPCMHTKQLDNPAAEAALAGLSSH